MLGGGGEEGNLHARKMKRSEKNILRPKIGDGATKIKERKDDTRIKSAG